MAKSEHHSRGIWRHLQRLKRRAEIRLMTYFQTTPMRAAVASIASLLFGLAVVAALVFSSKGDLRFGLLGWVSAFILVVVCGFWWLFAIEIA